MDNAEGTAYRALFTEHTKQATLAGMIQYWLRVYSTYIACFLFYSKLEHSVTSIQPSGHYMYHQFNIQQF